MSMNKIGILTYHNNENRGAILQAYALCKAINETFSCEAEIIEYRTKSKEKSRRNSIFHTNEVNKLITGYKDRRLVEKFFKSELNTSDESIVTNDHAQAVRWLERQDYDILFTGSDEIWKVANSDDSGLLPPIFPSRPFPNLYFLDPNLSATKAAYAGSANTTDPSNLSEEELDTLKTHLNGYDHVSVRDAHTQELVSELGVDPVYKVPDPTILVDIPTTNVETTLEENGINTDEPILGIHNQGAKHVFEPICEHYRDRGYQIVTPTSADYADLELVAKVDPFEYYSTYEHFDIVVTGSLHSTIFSIKHGTPFVTIDTRDVYENIESKTHSLLDDFELLERHIDAVDGDASEFYDRTAEFEQPLDQDHIQNRINELRNKGCDFLRGLKDNEEKNRVVS